MSDLLKDYIETEIPEVAKLSTLKSKVDKINSDAIYFGFTEDEKAEIARALRIHLKGKA